MTWQASSIGSIHDKLFDFSAQIESNIADCFYIGNSGSKLYIHNRAYNSHEIFQYSLSTPWDISTASYDSKVLDVGSEVSSYAYGLAMNSTGTILFVYSYEDDTIYQYTLSTPWDISTGSYANKSHTATATVPSGLDVNPTGTKLYAATHYEGNPIYQHSMSSAWDISTLSYDNKSYVPVTGRGTGIQSFCFNPDGTQFYTVDFDNITEFNLASTWDISTASKASAEYTFSAAYANILDIVVTDDYLFALEPSTSKLYRFSNGEAPPFSPNLVRVSKPNFIINPYPILGGV